MPCRSKSDSCSDQRPGRRCADRPEFFFLRPQNGPPPHTPPARDRPSDFGSPPSETTRTTDLASDSLLCVPAATSIPYFPVIPRHAPANSPPRPIRSRRTLASLKASDAAPEHGIPANTNKPSDSAESSVLALLYPITSSQSTLFPPNLWGGEFYYLCPIEKHERAMRPEVTQLFPEGPQPAVLLLFRPAEYRHLRSEWPSQAASSSSSCAGRARGMPHRASAITEATQSSFRQ